MSVENPHIPERQYRQSDRECTRDIRAVAARVEEWLSGAASPRPHPESLDPNPRRRDVLDPSATRIGQPASPDDAFTGRDVPDTDDIGERLRRLHAEREAAMEGNEPRREQLDVARITQAVCNTLDLTPWERDRVLGVVCELDASAFGDRHTVPRVVLVLARRVVDAERRAWLGLDDVADDEPPERLRELGERLTRLTDSPAYTQLLTECDLSPAAVDSIEDALTRELDEETIREAAFGRSPHRDPALPAFEQYAPGTDG